MEVVLLDHPMAGYLRRYVAETSDLYADFNIYSQTLKPKLIELCNILLNELRSFKIQIRVKVQFEKLLDTETTSEAFFSNKQTTILPATNLPDEINQIFEAIANHIEEFCANGSDWTITQISRSDIHIAQYQPIVAAQSTFVHLPRAIAKKRAIINIQNSDNQCFKWAILSALHPAQHNPHRLSQYRKHEHLYKFTSFDYPFNIRDIPRFEAEHDLSIFVYGYEDALYPLYRTTKFTSRHIHLLLLQNPDNTTAPGHFCWIKDLNRLLFSTRKHRSKSYFCPLCLFSFTSQARVDNHFEICSSGGCRIMMPNDEQKALKFTSTAKMLRQPCVFYADFESLLMKISTAIPGPHLSSTNQTAHHEPCGFALFQVIQCCNETKAHYPYPVRVERRKNPVTSFLELVVERSIEYHEAYIKNRQPMPVLTGEEWSNYFSYPNCTICEIPFSASCLQCINQPNRRKWCKQCRAKIWRDHCHICRRFRGPAHVDCNLSYKLSPDVCVFMHNTKRYDGHLIMQHIAPFVNKYGYSIECIPKAMDSYIMFALKMIPLTDRSRTWKIKFLDSFQFLACSLDRLVGNLRAGGDEMFSAVQAHCSNNNNLPLLLRKGVYPYEYMDSWEKFLETTLPAPDKFYSSLSETMADDDDYRHAQQVWNNFNIQNMGQYHDLYLATDTLLLCDIIENFRNVCLKNYRLDPAHYVTLPSFGWDAVLRRSPVPLDLLTDPDMYTFFETGIRGGVSTVTTRYAKANNNLLPHFNDRIPTSFIASFDANNFYGYAMSQMLPISDFTWMSHEELERIDVSSIPDDADYGCVLEVDLHYPPKLHEMHNDYPLAPEHIIVSDSMLSKYSLELRDKLQLKSSTQRKLIPNVCDKRNYIVHYKNLKLYLRLGLQLQKINRGIRFKQAAWMKPYISLNTEQRKKAKSDFEKDLFKLLNNSVFGKSMENVRAYADVELVTKPERTRTLVSNPRFCRYEVFDNDLVAIMMSRKTLHLKKPIYTGFTVLELSKYLMYDFHYNFVIPKFPLTKLLFTDTDSLAYSIRTKDLYNELLCHSETFDFSDYPKDHALFSLINKKVMGKMKDETNGIPIDEFVGLRSKMYSIKCSTASKKRAKGVSKTIVKKRIRHEDFIMALTSGRIMRHRGCQIKNFGHQLYTVSANKISLCAYDDKRFILNDGIQTVAFGHYMINGALCIKGEETAMTHDHSSDAQNNEDEYNLKKNVQC